MKPGSKSYFMFMRRIYWFSIAIIVMDIPPILIALTNGNNPWNDPTVSLFLTPGLIIIGVIHFLSAFEPIAEKPRWDRVFPELREQERKV